MSVKKFIVWESFFEALKKNGVLEFPEDTRKIVIEAEVGRPATITIHTFADEGLVKVLESIEETGQFQGNSIVQ